jgi:hypothetical protein
VLQNDGVSGQFSTVLARDLELLGAVRMKLFHTGGKDQDGCMISAVLKPKEDSG